jgi:hypothetical protein
MEVPCHYFMALHRVADEGTAFSINVKYKVSPLQVWSGPESCRRLRLPDFKTA